MKLKITLAVLAALVMVVPAQATIYGWEDGGTALGTYGNVVVSNSSAQAHSGSSSLLMTETPVGGTPQALVAFIEGLTDGDMVTASFWAYDVTPSASPSGRIWGHYGQSGDVGSYSGSASGNATYSDGSGWSLLSHTWTFDSDGNSRDSLIVEARIYSSAEFQTVYIDDIDVTTTSGTATITLPVPEPASIALLALGGLALIRRRR